MLSVATVDTATEAMCLYYLKYRYILLTGAVHGSGRRREVGRTLNDLKLETPILVLSLEPTAAVELNTSTACCVSVLAGTASEPQTSKPVNLVLPSR